MEIISQIEYYVVMRFNGKCKWVILRQITQFSLKIIWSPFKISFFLNHTNTSLWKTNSCKPLGPNSIYFLR